MHLSKYLLFITWLCAQSTAEAHTNRFRCMWRDNPSTSMVVGWNQENGKHPMLYLDTQPHESPDAFPHVYAPDQQNTYKRMSNRFVRLTGLQPNTVYYFMVKDSNSESRCYSFRTLPDDLSSISIIAGGDSRNNRKHRQNANLLAGKLRPHLVLFGGDMTGSDSSSAWKAWLDDWQLCIGEDGRIPPIVPARGNHESNNKVIARLFDAPNPDIYYALTLGGGLIRAYTLNSMLAPGGYQRDWLEKDLQEHPHVRWKIAQYHHPIRPHTARKTEKLSQQQYWAPLFYEYEMDLVVECDAHVVKTTYPIRPSREKGNDEGFVQDDQRGTVYIGEGCWGAPLRHNNDDKTWTRASGSFNQFKWIMVDAERISIRTIKTDIPSTIRPLSDANRFEVPEGLDIWTPETGAVVVIGENAAPPPERPTPETGRLGTSKSPMKNAGARTAASVQGKNAPNKSISENPNGHINEGLPDAKVMTVSSPPTETPPNAEYMASQKNPPKKHNQTFQRNLNISLFLLPLIGIILILIFTKNRYR